MSLPAPRSPLATRRAALRSRFAALSVTAVGLGAIVPILELRGNAALVALVAAVVAAGIQFVHVTRQSVGQTAAVALALLPCALGPLGRSVPRLSALAGGILVYLGAELARVAHDQQPDVPLDVDPPEVAVRSALLMAAAGGAAGAAVLVVSVIDLPAAAAMAVVGALAVLVLAVAVTRAPGAADPDDGPLG